MTDGEQDRQNIQADHDSVAVGSVSVGGSVDGSLIIGSHNVVGFTSDQVSTLIAQISRTFQPKPFDGRCPYKGLDVFEEEDAEMFFGREKLVEDLVGRVRESRTVFVTGPSGSGKSSLVRAGLIHALKQGGIKELNSDRWLYATLKPGRDPFEGLKNAFSRLKSPELGNYLRQNIARSDVLHECAEAALSERKDQRLVLFIDQFEEVFTQVSREEERVAFLELLTCAAEIENGRVLILFSMRSDFVPNCATYPKLNALLNRQFVQIGGMQPDELVSAIAQPALRVGLRIDPDLIAQIINDMQGEPGALPLMQFALKDLFDSQQARQARGGLIALTLNDYLQQGGIRKALERHADKTFAQLNPEEQALARSIFTGLIEIGRGTQDTRRTAIFEELVPAKARSDQIEMIVQKLADARLITTDEIGGKDTVTISHEKLIEAWPWLKKLVNENRDVIALQNEIAEDAKEWAENKRDASYLYSGARLVNANEQLKSNKLALGGTALEYIQASQARQRRGRLMVIGTVATIIALLVVAVIVFAQLTQDAQLQAQNLQTAVSVSNTRATAQASAEANAVEERNIAISRQLAAQAISNSGTHYDLAALLSVEAFHHQDTLEARSALLTGFQMHPNLVGYLQGHHSPIIALVFNPKENTLASASKDGLIILWDVEHKKATYELSANQDLSSLHFSPDGQTLLAGYKENTEWEEWNVRDPAEPGIPPTSPDWCLAECSQNVYRPVPSQLNIPDGHTEPITSVATSPNGKMLVSGSTDRSLIVWDISKTPEWNVEGYDNVRRITLPWQAHPTYVNRVAWSADGKTIASGDEDGNILLWSPPAFTAPPAPASNPRVKGVDVSKWEPKVDWKAVKNEGIGFAYAWTTNGTSKDPTFDLNWSTLLSLGIKRGAIQFFKPDVDPKQQAEFFAEQVNFLPGDLPPVLDLETVNDQTLNEELLTNVQIMLTEMERKTGRRPVIYTGFYFLRDNLLDRRSKFPEWLTEYPLWIPNYFRDLTDIESRQPIFPEDWPSEWVFWQYTERGTINGIQDEQGQPTGVDLDFYNGSQTDLANAADRIPFPTRPTGNPIPDLNSGLLADTLDGQPGPVNILSYSDSGKWLASGSADGKLILWDMQGKSDPVILQQGGIVINSISVSPDEHWLAIGNGDGTVQIWDLETHTLRTTLDGSKNRVQSVAFSMDSQFLVAAGCAEIAEAKCSLGQIKVWTLSDLHERVLTAHTDEINSLAFRPDGKQMASGSEDGTIIFWNVPEWTNSDPKATRPMSSILNLTFSHSGKLLAAAAMDGNVSIWDVANQQLSGEPLRGHTRPVFGLSFNKDDSLLASGGWDKTIILWNIQARQPVGDPLHGHTDHIYSLAFSPDGKTLVSGGWDNKILLWNMDLQSWIEKACQMAGRNFSRAEWMQYFPETAYPAKPEDATCPEWPLEQESKAVPTVAP